MLNEAGYNNRKCYVYSSVHGSQTPGRQTRFLRVSRDAYPSKTTLELKFGIIPPKARGFRQLLAIMT